MPEMEIRMKCTKCGNTNVEGVAYCVWCGAAIAQGKGESDSSLLGGRIIALIFGAFILCMALVWFFDAPAIKDDYTVADLRSAAEEYNESFEILTSLAEEDKERDDAPAIGLTADDVNAINAISEVIKSYNHAAITEAINSNTSAIRQAWQNGEKGRAIIAKLAEFPEIADLSEPKAISDWESDKLHLCYINIRYLAYLYRAYAMLEVENGNDTVAATELVRFDSVCRKLNINARSLLTKVVCFGIMSQDMQTAGYIAGKPWTSDTTARLLSEHFKPLTNTESSLRNAFITEYLTCDKTLLSQFGKKLRIIPGIIKINSTRRLYRNECDKWLAMSDGTALDTTKRLNVWPVFGPRWIDVELNERYKLPWTYMCYNPLGGFFIQIFAPAMERVCDIKMQLQVQDDMLQIVLAKRLGKEVSLKARAYGDEYIIDLEGKRILSPGPDGKVGTKDDITMPIDPNVVRW